jgi:hypothetical protein
MPRTDDLVVDLESAFEHYDGVGSGVPMKAGLETSRVPDEVVLRSRQHRDLVAQDELLGILFGRAPR